MLSITVYGRPLSKQRHESSIRGHGENVHIHEFNPMSNVNHETLLKLRFMEKYPTHIPYEKDVPLVSLIKIYFMIPNGAKKDEKDLMLRELIYPTKKPDNDNVEKISWDALNQIAFADDCQIVKNITEKFYSDRPRVEIYLMTVDEFKSIYF